MTGCNENPVDHVMLSPDQIADVLDMIQTAQEGSWELDARIDCALTGRIFQAMHTQRGYRWRSPAADAESGDAEPAACWSQDVMASLRMIPDSHNYSVGRRDGVCWAWIQPNDSWCPAETEYRHDHPAGSGLLVACTLSLALMSAAMIMTQRLPHRTLQTPHIDPPSPDPGPTAATE